MAYSEFVNLYFDWHFRRFHHAEWRDRGIIPNEHLASGTDEPWSTWKLEEFESAESESAERTLSGHDENVEALP